MRWTPHSLRRARTKSATSSATMLLSPVVPGLPTSRRRATLACRTRHGGYDRGAMQLHMPYFVLIAILLSMVALGLAQKAVDWRPPSRSCPSCGRDLDRD